MPFDPVHYEAMRDSGMPFAVVFHADWCPTCRAQAPVLIKLTQSPEFMGVTLLVASFGTEKVLERSLEISKQSTIVLFKDGKEAARSTGDTQYDNLRKILSRAIPYFRRYRAMTWSAKRITVLCTLIGVSLDLGTGNLRAQPNAPRRPAVVELYTSQGCSSCPPADAVLGELAQIPNVVALAFHVSYWDSIGWPDHFALPIALVRQQRYVETLGLSSAFTPQAVVDGRGSFVGSDKRRILAAMLEPRDTIPIELEIAHDELTVSLPDRKDRAGYEVNLAAYLPKAQTRVGRGENSGQTLREFNIVRLFRTLGAWDGREAVFHVPLEAIPADASHVAVLLQRAGQGPIAGSALAALR
jgi:thiol-disulfide isomerase/thioredoxin